MALNLKKNERSMLEAWNWMKSANKAGKWVLYDYEGKTFNLQNVGTGDGGLEELTEEFSDGRIMYGAVCVEDPNSGLPKIVFIVWQGLSVPEIVRGKCAVHADAVLKFFKGFHVNITARGESDIDEKTVLEKVKHCSGANYGVHKEKPVPREKQSHPVASYEKIDPTKEISSTAREEFWKREAENSSHQESQEKQSVLRAQEAKTSGSAADTFRKMEQERLQKEKELENERIKRQAAVKDSIKHSSQDKAETSESVEKKEPDFKNLQSGKTNAFKAMFEKKIDEQTESISIKPPVSRTTKKWEPVQTKPVAVEKSQPPPPVESRVEASIVPESPINKPSFAEVKRPESEMDFPAPQSQSSFQEASLPSVADKSSSETFNVIALYDYDAGDDTEISFAAGEKITDVFKEDEEWWVGTNSKGKRGQLPYNFVALEGSPEANEVLETLVAEAEDLSLVQILSKAKVIYDYTASDTDELTIIENEILSILEKRNDGWWVAQNRNGVTGLVPCNFVEEQ